jgi:hypothetical protein
MRKIWFLLVLGGFIMLFFWLVFHTLITDLSSFAGAEKISLLGNRHKDTGIECEGCHKEKPPKEKVPTAVCLSCHKDFSKTSPSNKNAKKGDHPKSPHDQYEISECGLCHHIHRPSEDVCKSCHDFGFKIP